MVKILVASSLILAVSGAPLLATTGTAIENDYIVVMKPSKSRAALTKTTSRCFTKEVWRNIPGFSGFSARMNQYELEEMMADEDVDYIERDQRVYAIGSFRGQTVEESCSATQTDAPWGLSRVTHTSGNSTNSYEHDPSWGQGVKIYVIDTGSNCEHEDFNEYCTCGPTFQGGSDGCSDGNGHGTHCASTATGKLYGVAKSAQIVGVKVLGDNGSGSTSGVISGMNWVASQGAGSVASMSLGGGYSAASNAAADAMTAAGVTVVVAAGNDYAQDACGSSPASASTAYTVGATDKNDKRSSFSNIGSCVNVFAPGSEITAAWYTPGTTNTISGTSMATPHVAGAAAAILSKNPSFSPSEVKATLDELALTDVLSDVGSNSPNKLLHLDC